MDFAPVSMIFGFIRFITGHRDRIQAHIAVWRFSAFSACVIGCGCWEHLMSVESMRRQLNALQYSVLVKSATDEKYAMPSRASAQAKRIYRSVSLSWNESPFRLKAKDGLKPSAFASANEGETTGF